MYKSLILLAAVQNHTEIKGRLSAAGGGDIKLTIKEAEYARVQHNNAAALGQDSGAAQVGRITRANGGRF